MPVATRCMTLCHPRALHEDVMTDVSPQIDRFRFRTGERNKNASDRMFAAAMHDPVTPSYNRMTRIDENIHVSPTSYATVAPILHNRMRTNPANRSTTLRKGAADATGR